MRRYEAGADESEDGGDADASAAERHNESMRLRRQAQQQQQQQQQQPSRVQAPPLVWQSDGLARASARSSSLASSRASARQAVAAGSPPRSARRSHSGSIAEAHTNQSATSALQPLASLSLAALMGSSDEDLQLQSSGSKRATSAGAVASPTRAQPQSQPKAVPRSSSASLDKSQLSHAPLTFLADRAAASPRRSPHHIQPLALSASPRYSPSSSPLPTASPRSSPTPALHSLLRSETPLLSASSQSTTSGVHGASVAASALPPGMGVVPPAGVPAPKPVAVGVHTRGTAHSTALGRAGTLAPLHAVSAGDTQPVVSLRQINSLLHQKPDPMAALCAPECMSLLRRFVQQNQDPATSPYLHGDSSGGNGGDLRSALHHLSGQSGQTLMSLLLHPHLSQRGDVHQLVLTAVKILTRKPENREAHIVTAALMRCLLSQLRATDSSASVRKEAANALFNLCFEAQNVNLLLECDGMATLMQLIEAGGAAAASHPSHPLDPLSVGVTGGVAGVLHSVCYQTLGTSCFLNYTHEDQGKTDATSAFDLTLTCIHAHLRVYETLQTECGSDGNGSKSSPLLPPLVQLLSRSAGLLLNLSAHPRAVQHLVTHPLGMEVLVSLLRLRRDELSASAIGALANVSRHPASRRWIDQHDGQGDDACAVLTLLAECLFLPRTKAACWAVTALLGFCADPEPRARDGPAASPLLRKYRALLHAFLANSVVLGMIQHCHQEGQGEGDEAALE